VCWNQTNELTTTQTPSKHHTILFNYYYYYYSLLTTIHYYYYYSTTQTRASTGQSGKGLRAYVFGSAANGLGSPESDIDVTIRLPFFSAQTDAELPPREHDERKAALDALAAALEAEQGWAVQEVRHGARVPLIVCNFWNGWRTLHVDISLNNLEPLKNVGSLLYYFFVCYSLVRGSSWCLVVPLGAS